MIGETTTAAAESSTHLEHSAPGSFMHGSITLGESNLPPPGVVGWAPGAVSAWGMLFYKKKMLEDGTCIITLGTCWTSSARAIPTAPGQIHTHKTRTYAALLLYNIGRKTRVCSNLAAVQILFIYTYKRISLNPKNPRHLPPSPSGIYLLPYRSVPARQPPCIKIK